MATQLLRILAIHTRRMEDLSKVVWQESPRIAGEVAIPFQLQVDEVYLCFRKIILAMILRPTRSTELAQIIATLAPTAEAFHLKVPFFPILPIVVNPFMDHWFVRSSSFLFPSFARTAQPSCRNERGPGVRMFFPWDNLFIFTHGKGQELTICPPLSRHQLV